MAMKEWVRRMQPVQLYVVLVLTIVFFLVELVVSHLTHALTLLMDSYHTLCNIMALGGCILTIKYAEKDPGSNLQTDSKNENNIGEELTSNPSNCHDKNKIKTSVTRINQERKLKNTFGWARTDVIFMVICCVFLASLSFSILIESVQTLIHIDHHDEMHHPISVLCLGAAGLLLNGVTYLLIGGYTFHQGSFLYVTESGDVVLSKVVIDQSLKQGARRLSRSKTIHSNVVSQQRQRQGLWEMTRDINGCILVIICAIIVFFTDKLTAKYVDPLIALLSSGFIMVLSYPYMKESCLILLQTMPDTMNIDTLKVELLNHFPDIINVHDFHIWQLTANKVISTVHIIFQSPKVYKQVIEEIKEFFIENGITQVTIQPEFFRKNDSMESINSKYTPNCLVSCIGEGCKQSHCCPEYEDKNITKTGSKEILPGSTIPNLKSIKNMNEEIPTATPSNNNFVQENYHKDLERLPKEVSSSETFPNTDPPPYFEVVQSTNETLAVVETKNNDESDCVQPENSETNSTILEKTA